MRRRARPDPQGRGPSPQVRPPPPAHLQTRNERAAARGKPLQPGDMKEPKRQSRKWRPARDAPELRVAGIDVNPAPDARDRLRRRFSRRRRQAES